MSKKIQLDENGDIIIDYDEMEKDPKSYLKKIGNEFRNQREKLVRLQAKLTSQMLMHEAAGTYKSIKDKMLVKAIKKIQGLD